MRWQVSLQVHCISHWPVPGTITHAHNCDVDACAQIAYTRVNMTRVIPAHALALELILCFAVFCELIYVIQFLKCVTHNIHVTIPTAIWKFARSLPLWRSPSPWSKQPFLSVIKDANAYPIAKFARIIIPSVLKQSLIHFLHQLSSAPFYTTISFQ